MIAYEVSVEVDKLEKERKKNEEKERKIKLRKKTSYDKEIIIDEVKEEENNYISSFAGMEMKE